MASAAAAGWVTLETACPTSLGSACEVREPPVHRGEAGQHWADAVEDRGCSARTIVPGEGSFFFFFPRLE